MAEQKVAVIIGAGPAGLTAAYELLQHTNIRPIVIERDPEYVGGISRTVNFEGNRIDIGGHRFFSKSDRIMRWWSEILPISMPDGAAPDITYQRTTRALVEGLKTATKADGDAVMHIRPRLTHILYNGELYDYPISLSLGTLSKLGPHKVLRIGITYLAAVLFPIRPERTLEDFLLNRFGKELYLTFFKDYTEKVWGKKCSELSAEWGAQRIKGLSIRTAITHAARKILRIGALSGKHVETSLIEQFLYPTLGPGQMWEVVADKIRAQGGEIRMDSEVVTISGTPPHLTSVTIRRTGIDEVIPCDYVFSSTDIRQLLRMLPTAPANITGITEKLEYRDFITVGLLLESKPLDRKGQPMKDTWMYIHEPSVNVGRLQFFHNWHPQLVANQAHGWLGLEYFCSEDDMLWNMTDGSLIELAGDELERIGIRQGMMVLKGTVIRQKKAYPTYFGAYEEFSTVREHLDSIDNLFPIGRNGMHRYNNQDHSMLAAMEAVETIVANKDKSQLWNINTEQAYHETK